MMDVGEGEGVVGEEWLLGGGRNEEYNQESSFIYKGIGGTTQCSSCIGRLRTKRIEAITRVDNLYAMIFTSIQTNVHLPGCVFIKQGFLRLSTCPHRLISRWIKKIFPLLSKNMSIGKKFQPFNESYHLQKRFCLLRDGAAPAATYPEWTRWKDKMRNQSVKGRDEHLRNLEGTDSHAHHI